MHTLQGRNALIADLKTSKDFRSLEGWTMDMKFETKDHAPCIIYSNFCIFLMSHKMSVLLCGNSLHKFLKFNFSLPYL